MVVVLSSVVAEVTVSNASLPCSLLRESPARASLMASEQYMPTEYTWFIYVCIYIYICVCVCVRVCVCV